MHCFSEKHPANKTRILNYMNKLFSNTIIVKLLLSTLFSLFFQLVYCQTGEAAVDGLVKMGFENVSWKEDDAERIYVIQNSAYRLEGMGISVAVDLIQKMGLPYRKPCLVNISYK